MEHQFHQWIKQNFKQSPPASGDDSHVILGPGDDAAILRIESGRSILVATDTIAEGTHFDLKKHELELVGRKSLAVNLSDIAAMGGRPDSAVLNFMLPKHFGIEEAKSIYNGVQKLAARFSVAVVGGDSNRWDGKLVVGATVLGSRRSTETGWSIGGAEPGDAIVVTGEFGGSIHGRHLSFDPRVELALYLADNFQINGATDVSDSLSLDLNAMLLASQSRSLAHAAEVLSSRLGADLDLAAIPISNDVAEADANQRVNRALTDGEDFELILAVSSDQVDQLLADEWITSHPCSLTRIGTFTDKHAEIRAVANGKAITIQPEGYVH